MSMCDQIFKILPFGLLWATLGYFGLLCAILGYFWLLLATFGYFWLLLATFGYFDYFWLLWATLGYFGLLFTWPIFTQTSYFHPWFAVNILRFQMGLEVDVLAFQIKLWYRYFGFFGHFFQNFGNILINFLVTLLLRWPDLRTCWQYLKMTNSLASCGQTWLTTTKNFFHHLWTQKC